MQITVVKETNNIEKRVAITPDIVKKLVAQNIQIVLEKNAGFDAGFDDELYKEAGARIEKDKSSAYQGADIVLRVSPIKEDEISLLPRNSILIGCQKPYNNRDINKILAEANITSFSMDLLPRITRAQSMDILSSQNNLAGYRAVIEAASLFKKGFPLLMTAAGTIPAAKVMIMGVGVAGLQAIATAKRLGGIVCAYDVRAAAKEQVASLGASFISVDFAETGEGSGGYAKEMSDDYKKAEEKTLLNVIQNQDIVITTAQIPGKTAPILINEEMVSVMRAGSVIIDMAAENGGNCTATKLGKVIVTKNGVQIAGHYNLANFVPYHASQLYSKNIFNFLQLIIAKDNSDKLAIDWQDEIVHNSLLTKDGKVVHAQFLEKP